MDTGMATARTPNPGESGREEIGQFQAARSSQSRSNWSWYGFLSLDSFA